jgi:hypothetical protein
MKKYILFILVALFSNLVYAVDLIELDFNDDSRIDISDLSAQASDFGQTTGYDTRFDINKNNKVDINDLIYTAKKIGQSITYQEHNYDIVIVGAGSGGIAAAIQASRMGANVALLEETDYIGGQMITVPNMDEALLFREKPSGFYKEFIDNINGHYSSKGKSISTCYWSPTTRCFEPYVGKEILKSMLTDAGVDSYLVTKVSKVLKSGNRITGVQTKNLKQFNSKIVIDATEYGDIILLGGIEYMAGNSLSTSLNPSACVQDITYTTIMKKYPNGVPQRLIINSPPPGYEQSKAKFQNIVTLSGTPWNGNYPTDWNSHNAYRGVPDSSNPSDYTAVQSDKITKTGVNWANDYSYSVAALTNFQARKTANCEAKLHTIQFIYYVQKELNQPLWSIADDEGFNTQYNLDNQCDNIPQELKEIELHMPPFPYIRESIRILPTRILTAKDIFREGEPRRGKVFFSSAVALGDYPVDLHGCHSQATLEQNFESTSDIPTVGKSGPFQIPFESFIPKTVDGFLPAEKNIGQSRLANGATRLQPSTMMTGQAAGAIAAIAVRKNIQPRQVNYREVQQELLNSKIILYPFSDVLPTDWYFKQVNYIALKGIMGGNTDLTFRGSDKLTRAMMAVTISKSAGYSIVTPESPTFQDVPTTHWAYPYIETIKSNGITSGCDTSNFCPERNVKRAEMAVFLVKIMGSQPNPACKGYFTDSAGHWACEFFERAYELGLMGGSNGYFNPESEITRAEAAVSIYNYLDKSGKLLN